MTLERYRDSKLLLCKYFLKYCLWISKRKAKKKKETETQAQKRQTDRDENIQA